MHWPAPWSYNNVLQRIILPPPLTGEEPTSCQARSGFLNLTLTSEERRYLSQRWVAFGVHLDNSDLFFYIIGSKVNGDMPQSFLAALLHAFDRAWPSGPRVNTFCANNHIFRSFKCTNHYCVLCFPGCFASVFAFFSKLQLVLSLRVASSFRRPFAARPQQPA